MQAQPTLGLTADLQLDFEMVLKRVTEIDIQDTLGKKLDVEFRPYRILGACNPTLAYRARVSIVDPLAMLGIISDESLRSIAEEARERLDRVVMALEV